MLAATLQVSAAAAIHQASAPPVPAAQPRPRRSRQQAPAFLRDRINELGRSFNGRVGIAVKSVDEGWTIGWKADELYPQQSVSKLWVSITALDAVDKGRVRLDDQVSLTRDDLTLFHQPIAALIRQNGGYTTSLGDLMFKAITTSDNTANDKLMRSVGGPERGARDDRSARISGAIRFYNGERALQSRIAGLIWTPELFDRQRLLRGARRTAVGPAQGGLQPLRRGPLRRRRAERDRRRAGAAQARRAAVAAIDRAPARHHGQHQDRRQPAEGRARSRAGRSATRPAPARCSARQQAGYNDIGILTAPDGRSYAVAVMIKLTSVPLPMRMTLMNNVVRAVIAQHDDEMRPLSLHADLGRPRRLAGAPGVQRVPTRELELFIVRGFLDAETCAALVERIDAAAAAVRDRRRPRDRQFPDQRNLRPRLARPGGRRGRPQDRRRCWACRSRPASRSRASAMRRARSSSRTPTRSSPAATISMSTPPTRASARGPR